MLAFSVPYVMWPTEMFDEKFAKNAQLKWRLKANAKRCILTQSGQFECVGRVDYIDVCLQLESPRCYVQIVIQHCEFECRLHFVRALLENGACGRQRKEKNRVRNLVCDKCEHRLFQCQKKPKLYSYRYCYFLVFMWKHSSVVWTPVDTNKKVAHEKWSEMAHFGSQTHTKQATIFPATIRFNNAWAAFSLLASGILIERARTNMNFAKNWNKCVSLGKRENYNCRATSQDSGFQASRRSVSCGRRAAHRPSYELQYIIKRKVYIFGRLCARVCGTGLQVLLRRCTLHFHVINFYYSYLWLSLQRQFFVCCSHHRCLFIQ